MLRTALFILFAAGAFGVAVLAMRSPPAETPEARNKQPTKKMASGKQVVDSAPDADCPRCPVPSN
jgi:hypothetical protein